MRQRLPRPEIADLIEPIQDRLDTLVARARQTPISARRYDELEEEGQAIGVALRAAFRGARR